MTTSSSSSSSSTSTGSDRAGARTIYTSGSSSSESVYGTICCGRSGPESKDSIRLRGLCAPCIRSPCRRRAEGKTSRRRRLLFFKYAIK
eukprot:6323145-Karenia_brevis.AAC.1